MSSMACGCESDGSNLCQWHQIENLQELSRNLLKENWDLRRGQSRRQSWIESITNVIVGYIVAILTQVVVYPILDIHVTLGENFLISLIFTLVSLVRSYGLRRAFNRWNR